MVKQLLIAGSLLIITVILLAVAENFLNNPRFLTADFSALFTASSTSTSSASSTASSSVSSSSTYINPTLADILQGLQNQVQFQEDQILDLNANLEAFRLQQVFTRNLKRGDSGDDVTALQNILVQTPGTYEDGTNASDTLTGYFGHTTEQAIMQFQDQSGLKSTGIFDKETKTKLLDTYRDIIAQNMTQGNSSTEFAPNDFASATNLQEQNNQAISELQGQVSELNSNASSTQDSLSNLQDQISQVSNDLATLQTDIQTLQVTSQNPTPLPPTPLVISNIQSGTPSKTSSTITWSTNNQATSEVDYSTNSSFPHDQIHIVTSAQLTTSHNIGLSSLNSGTKYYYFVLSSDGNGSTASSSILSFTTNH